MNLKNGKYKDDQSCASLRLSLSNAISDELNVNTVPVLEATQARAYCLNVCKHGGGGVTRESQTFLPVFGSSQFTQQFLESC
jgi:hypothetical protein